MRRVRKCCCPCKDGQIEIVAESGITSGTWDLKPYQDLRFSKYQNKYWRIHFPDDGRLPYTATVVRRGKIDGSGKMTDLPSSIRVTNGPYFLTTACSPICGDDDYFGEVIATNAGIEDAWDISFLNDMIAPEHMRGGWWRMRKFCGDELGDSQYLPDGGQISPDGVFADVPTEPIDSALVISTIGGRFDRRYYAEIVAVCNEHDSFSWPPIAPLHGGGAEEVFATGSYQSIYDQCHDKPGVFAPGAMVRKRGDAFTSRWDDDSKYYLVEWRGGDSPISCDTIMAWKRTEEYCVDSVGRILLDRYVTESGRYPTCPLSPPYDAMPYIKNINTVLLATT